MNMIICTGVVSLLALASSCSNDSKSPGLEYMPDMYRSPSYEVYSSNPNFKDSMSMRLPVKGTIPRNFVYFDYPSTNEGYEAASREVKNPLPATSENLEEGKRLYNIDCVHCHGEAGQGDGTIVSNGKFPPPPSYSKGNSSRGGLMKDLTDGKIFHTITYGINLMGSHASQILPEERWKIVMYIHQLQKGEQAADSTAVTTPEANKVTAAK